MKNIAKIAADAKRTAPVKHAQRASALKLSALVQLPARLPLCMALVPWAYRSARVGARVAAHRTSALKWHFN
eukprot:9918298-Lingulodinium_polyedra.AAC.1